jgi:DOPA 4,5-dioxygenase
VRHRAANTEGPDSSRVWLFHSHAYFDHAAPERVAEAREYMNLIGQTFAATRHVEVHSFVPAPVGPHPCGSFEVLFTREALADYLPWLMFTRPRALAILIHPLTRSQVPDHTVRALWLGTPVAIDRAFLEAVDAELLGSSLSEETIIEGTKKH